MSHRLIWHEWGPGGGQSILCLHGFMGSGADWGPFAEALLDRDCKLHVVAPDLPGHGGSPGVFDIPSLASALANGPVDPPCLLVGYSMGARLAFHLLLHDPEPFFGLAVVSGSPGIEDPAERRERGVRDAALAERLRAMPRDGSAFAAFLEGWWRLPVFVSPRRRETPPEGFLSSRLKNDPVRLADSLEAWSPASLPALWNELPNNRLPTLFLAGDHDVPYARVARRAAEACPHAACVLVENAGHSLPAEAPAEIARAVHEHFFNPDPAIEEF